MEDTVLKECTTIINDYIEKFSLAIDNEVSIDNKAVHPGKPDFPVFRMANSEFFEYQFHERILEWKIRDYLVTGIIQSLFDNSVISPQTKIYPLHDSRINIVRFSFSNTHFGEEYPFAFILETEQDRIGIRYSDICIEEKELKRLLRYHKISHIEVIDWSDTDKYETNKTSCNSEKCRAVIHFLTLRKFFSLYFSDEIYHLYLSKVREAVDISNQKLGFHTIPMLSLRYISDFKEQCLAIVSNHDFCNSVFHKTGDLLNSKSVNELFSETDIESMYHNFINNELYKILAGEEDFARCFVTAEYLYTIFKNRDSINFDYTAVVAGYFKTIELLLYKISLIWLDGDIFRDLWIHGGNPSKAKDVGCEWCRLNPAPKSSGTQVKFEKAYEKYFKTDMGSLIWLLYDNSNGWSISGPGRTMIHNLLSDYKQGCRNDYMHKDVIRDLRTTENIRDNTLLCLFFILGGCIITGNPSDDIQKLGSGDTSYERLYKKLLDFPRLGSFYIQMSKNTLPVKAIKLFDQKKTTYNEKGNITTPIEFILVDDFSEANFETNQEYEEIVRTHDLFAITRNTIPYKLWFYNKHKGKVEVTW